MVAPTKRMDDLRQWLRDRINHGRPIKPSVLLSLLGQTALVLVVARLGAVPRVEVGLDHVPPRVVPEAVESQPEQAGRRGRVLLEEVPQGTLVWRRGR